MDFKIQKRDNPNRDMYKNDEIDIAYAFSKKVIKEFGTFIKSIVLFGSIVRNEKSSHDIDILVIVDDVSVVMTNELVETYRVIMEKIVGDSSRKLHVTTLKMTNFWDFIRRGDPLGINILRDGVALYDTSLFDPLRILLSEGKVAPSNETINLYLNKSLGSMLGSRNQIVHATLDLYWAVIDIAHASLMKNNVMPSSPAKVADMLIETFTKKKKLEIRYVNIMRKFYKMSRSIIHNEKTTVSGKEYDAYYKEASMFIERMKKLLKEQ